MERLPFLPTTGGGGMADPTFSEVLLASLVYIAILAAALIIAGIVLLKLYGFLNPSPQRELDRLEQRLTMLESPLDRFFQTQGDFTEWAEIKRRDEQRDR